MAKDNSGGITAGELIQALKTVPWNHKVMLSEGDAILMEITSCYHDDANEIAYLDVVFLDEDEDDKLAEDFDLATALPARPPKKDGRSEEPEGEVEILDGDIHRGLGSAYQSLMHRRM
ncbi:MAG TPA: hypothetical protein VKA31_11450 [Mariprofundaceae bacterium]|nr:hypothetical protein [Mariprofundaceae bacterium]